MVGSLAHDLDHEIPASRQAHQLAPVVSTIGKQALEKGPALTHGLDALLGTLGILHIGRREVDQQQAPVWVDRIRPLAALYLRGRVIAASARAD